MTVYLLQKETINNCVTDVSSVLSVLSVKSKEIIKEFVVFGKYLLLILSLTVYSRQKEKISKYLAL